MRQRLHPLLGEKLKKWHYTDAYEKSILTPKDLFKNFIKVCMGKHVPQKQLEMLSHINDQNLTNRLYSIMYEKLAEDFTDRTISAKKTKVNSTIELDQYL